jgi:replicative DNA helicase
MATERIEDTILRNLFCNEQYYRKVVPHLDGEYFQDPIEKILFEEILDFSGKYDKVPTKEVLRINLGNRTDLTEETYKNTSAKLDTYGDEWVDFDWLVDSTEKWCQDRAIYNALLKSVKIADGNDEKLSKDAIPTILQEALGVTFDEHIGHDYIESADDRYEFYHREEEKIPFDLEKFNYITKGGLPNKTLNVALAGTGVGKSLFMCHMASACLLQSKNVLYVTLEMSEEKIAERIDANCLNLSIKDIVDIPQVMFKSKISDLQKKTTGKIIVKEYPTASAHAGHFRSLLNELKLKKSFIPDIIFVDYLNICASSRYKGHIVNSYTYVKAIAEELRGLAVEFDLPIVSATQTTRAGFGSSDPDLTDTSESFGLPATADLMFALISSEELEAEGRLKVKQLKNRYNDPTSHRSFRVGIDRAKMKLFDVADSTSAVYDAAQEEDAADAYDTVKQNQARLSKFAEWNV